MAVFLLGRVLMRGLGMLIGAMLLGHHLVELHVQLLPRRIALVMIAIPMKADILNQVYPVVLKPVRLTLHLEIWQWVRR